MTRTRALALLVVVPLVAGLLGGCQESAEDRREAYCKQVKEDSGDLTRISDEGGAGAFLQALPILEGLAEKSPDDLADEWRTFLDALHGLEDAVEEVGLDPEDVDGGLPKDLPRADRRRVRGAASVLARDDVVAATQGIEQHALDICGTQLL